MSGRRGKCDGALESRCGTICCGSDANLIFANRSCTCRFHDGDRQVSGCLPARSWSGMICSMHVPVHVTRSQRKTGCASSHILKLAIAMHLTPACVNEPRPQVLCTLPVLCAGSVTGKTLDRVPVSSTCLNAIHLRQVSPPRCDVCVTGTRPYAGGVPITVMT